MALGEAPFHRVVTLMVGRSTSGIASTSIFGSAYTASTTKAMKIIQVLTGWRTKNRVMDQAPLPGSGRRTRCATM